MKMKWFGTTWHAPINELEHVPTPVGERCLFCREPIGATERGVVFGAVVRDSVKGLEVSPTPVHFFCYLRNTLGRGLAAQIMDQIKEREGA